MNQITSLHNGITQKDYIILYVVFTFIQLFLQGDQQLLPGVVGVCGPVGGGGSHDTQRHAGDIRQVGEANFFYLNFLLCSIFEPFLEKMNTFAIMRYAWWGS